MMQRCHLTVEDITSLENLLEAWSEFLVGKRNRDDVLRFQEHLMNSLLVLRDELRHGTYRHDPYHAFSINDPKPRAIHKATVRDRVLHRAIYRRLLPFFDTTFIADSFSSRKGKGTHRAIERFRVFSQQVSQNNTQPCWVLKCDIRKFFDSIDHQILHGIVEQRIADPNLRWLLSEIVGSFHTTPGGKGLPLGNLTSQLLVNVYMNEFDQCAKHQLKAKYYLRYADDFVVLSRDRLWLEGLIPRIDAFLRNRLTLTLHPRKVSIQTLASGVDFLGWVHFPTHRVLRTSTKRRMLKRLAADTRSEVLNSYLGLLSHGQTHQLREHILAEIS